MHTVSALLVLAVSPATLAQVPSFNRDIRPILSEFCFHCHGPDSSKRKAGLDLSTAAGALEDLGDRAAIVPGKLDRSEMWRRIIHDDPKKRMPPASGGKTLSREQIEHLKRWIEAGARYEKHWAFIAPTRPAMPKIHDKKWINNPLDAFVLARLEKEGLKPSPEADRATLIRRVSFDLTGLPPTPAEVDAFVNDPSPKAYEKLVDRLLQSPRYGERMAHRWLDAARYADTNGYQTDGDRVMWRWRDWVIDAFNANMPFDQFTLEQLAGDLLPDATLEQKIATGFNRNHRGNSEGGVIPEEYAVEYVVDRVDTTSTVWLGLTMGCAKCHNHKYDPLSQKEFYQLFALFNNVPEKGKAIKYGNSPPYLKSPTREQAKQLRLLESQLRNAEKAWAEIQPAVAQSQLAWEQTVKPMDAIDWVYRKGLVASPALTNDPVFDGRRVVSAGDVGKFGFFDKFTISVWIKPTAAGGPVVTRMGDVERADGYGLFVRDGKVHVHLVKRWLDDAIRVETTEVVSTARWTHVLFSYDGSRLASGVKLYLDGRRANLKVNLDDLNQSFVTSEPLRIGGGAGERFVGQINNVQVLNRAVPESDVLVLATPDAINRILSLSTESRTPGMKAKLRAYFLDKQAPTVQRAALDQLERARHEYETLDESVPTTMVMEEMAPPRETHLLLRGEYDKKGMRVSPDLPAVFGAWPKDEPKNRLGFARWLVSKDNPLTARVAVNRAWQMLFGAGLVKSVEDFGAQGDWPSHPELLDWLASEFMDPTLITCCDEPPFPEAWDMKHLLKSIVTSATYRQSSHLHSELLQKDPENRLLARGPRVRLSAEMVRDQALAASGLLVEKVGGPSVKPYQPAGLVKELHGTDDYEQDHGPSLYRRSLYVYWKRTVAPPGLVTFDAANRETCVVRETRTNTPLQALHLLNDVIYVEAARVLAQRVLAETLDPEERLTRMFRRVLGRAPTTEEFQLLTRSVKAHRDQYAGNKEAARRLAQVGEYPVASIDLVELAAHAAVANMLFNLDEAITKE